MITYKKKEMNDVKRINLDDYIQTGEGATALTYTSKDGKTLAKLRHPSRSSKLKDYLED